MHRRAALAVALVVLLAGCSFGPGGSASSPTPTTESTPTESTPSGPQGLDGPEVNETALFFGHLRRVEQTNYQLRLHVSGVRNETFRQATEANQQPLIMLVRKPSGSSITYYTPGETVGIEREGLISFSQTTAAGYVTAFHPGGFGASPGDRRLASYLLTVDFRTAGTRTIDGTEYHVLRATGTDAFADRGSALPPERANATSYNATVLVDRQGIIRSYRATYGFPEGELRVNATVWGVGTTNVQRPDWVRDACQQTNFSQDISVDCTGF